MTHLTSTRDQKVYNRCILGALGSTHGGKWGIIWFVAVPRCRIFFPLECGTHNTGTRDIKEYNRCIMGALGSTHRGKRGIIWFVAAPRWIIFCSLECGTHNTGTRNNGVYNRCILGALGSTHRGKRGIIWLLKCTDAEFLVHLSVVLTNQHQGQKRCRTGASWGPW